MPPKKVCYVVYEGKRRGVYNTWDECSAQVTRVSGSKYKGFCSFEEGVNSFTQYCHNHNIQIDGLFEAELVEDRNPVNNDIISVEDIEMEEEEEHEDDESSESSTGMTQTLEESQYEMIKKTMCIPNDDANVFGLQYSTSPNGLYRTDNGLFVIAGDESVELYNRGLQHLLCNHLIEIGYKLIVPQSFDRICELACYNPIVLNNINSIIYII